MAKYNRNTHGIGAQVYLSPATAYSAQADVFAVVDNLDSLVNGEVAIIKVKDAAGNLIANGGSVETGALVAGETFKIVQVVDGEIQSSNDIVFGAADVRKVLYSAPVKQLQVIQVLSGAVTDSDAFALSLRNTSPSNQPFPVEEARFAAVTGSESAADVVAGIVANYESVNEIFFNFEQDYVVSANDGVALVAATIDVTNGSATATVTDATGITVGQVLLIEGVPYKVADVVGLTITLGAPYQGATNATAGLVKPGLDSIAVEAKRFGEHFKSTFLEDLDAVLTGQLDYKLGSGTPEDISRLEDEGQVFAGYNAGNIAFSADWGQPSKFVSLSESYDMIHIDYVKRQATVAHPVQEDVTRGNIILVYPAAGTTPKATIETVLGV